LFPLFQQLLGGVEQPIPGEFEFVSSGEWDVDQLDWMAHEQDEPQLDTPGVNEILQLGSIDNAGEKASWATAIRNAYRRYPAFQRELASCLGHAL